VRADRYDDAEGAVGRGSVRRQEDIVAAALVDEVDVYVEDPGSDFVLNRARDGFGTRRVRCGEKRTERQRCETARAAVEGAALRRVRARPRPCAPASVRLGAGR